MNRIYRLVFNAALGQVQVAAEFASAPQRAAVRSTRAGRLLPSLLAASVLAAMAPATQAADLPTGFAPVQNSATMSQNGSTMIISQNGKVSLINWTGFDIAQGSSVTFDMPSAAAGSINIISGAASVINGSLSSVGNVFLINTNGIVFNGGSTINVGGLLATSLPPIMSNLDVSENASLPAMWTFTGSGTPGAIVNRGSINAATGSVSLIGAIVENSGTINAAGTASLLAANSVTSIFTQPAAPSANDAGTWEHMLKAQSAGGVAASAINNTGYISGASVDMKSMVQSGTFFFGINSTGVVQAQGIHGGSLEFRTNAPANLDFGTGTGTTAGSIISTSTALSARGTATADSISLVSDNALDLGATLNSTSIALSGKQIGQTSGALKGAVTVTASGDATLNSTSNAITGLGGKVDGNLLLTSTTDVGQTSTLIIGGTTTLTGLAGSDGSLAGFNFNNSSNRFGSTVSGKGGDLVLATGDSLALGAFDVDSLAATGSTISLAGDVESRDAQTYTGPVTLGGDTTLSSAASGAVSFSGAVDGAHALTVNTAGTRTFGGAVGGATALSSLQTLGTGTTVLNGNVTSSGAIGLAGNVRLGADVALISTGDQTISLAGTVDSDGTARALALDTDGLAILGGSVGGSSVLASLTRTGTGATQLGGSISTVGNIDLQGALNVTGASTLDSSAGDIHVGGPIQSTNALGLQGGDIVVDGTIAAGSVVINGGTFDGAGIDSGGALTVTLTEGGLVQGGLYTAGGAATFDVAGDITLDNPQNQFGGSVALKGDTVKLSGQGNLSLGNVDAQALAVSSGGSISQSTATAIDVDTTSSFTATNGITLGRGGNVFGGAVTLQAGGAAQLVADGTLRFGNIDVGSLSASGTTIYLPQSLTTQGAQSWSGALLLEGDTSLSSTLGGLSFYGTLNGPHALSLDAAAGTVHLGAISTIGSLSSITAVETQLAADITTEGNLDLGRSRVQGDVALTSTAGSVRINGALNGLSDDADTLAISADGSVSILGETGGDSRLHDLALSGNTVSTAAVDVGNDLSIDSVASLTQTARYRVGGTAEFTSLGDITLQHPSNQFMGDVALSGNAVHISGLGALTLSGVNAMMLQANAQALLTLRDATVVQSTTLTGDAVQLDSVALGQTSKVTAAGGNISQTGAVGVDGASTWTAMGDIVLGDGTNQFGGPVTAEGSNITLSADSALNLGSVTAAGVAQLSGRGVHLGSVQANSLQVQSSAGITQGNALAVVGTAGFNATDDVVLDNPNNSFASGVQLSGRDIRIASASGLTLAGVNATGDLHATAHAGNLLQSGSVNVQGRSDLVASGNVQLDSAGNRFNGAIAAEGRSILLRAGGGLDVESLRNGSNGAVQLVATGDIDLGGAAVNTGTNLLSLLSSAGQVRTATALTGGQVSITGVEGIRIGGDITANSLSLVSSRNNIQQQAGRIQSGTTLLGAGQGDLLLENTSNRFTGVTTLSGRDVRVAAGDLTLGMVAASRDLRLVSSGSIQQQSQMSVGGAADLRAAGDITLRHINNSFEGDVALQAAQASLYAAQGLSLAQVDVDGLQATTLGLLSLRDAQVTGLADLHGASLALARADVGRLDATAFADGITQSDTVTLGDGSELRATGNVMLDRPDNHLGSGLQVRGADVVLSTLGVLDQADVQASGLARLSGEGVQLGSVSAGSLQVYSQGDIDQGVALQVTGDSRFSATGDIRLGHAGNQFGGGVQLAGHDVRIENAGHLRLDGVAADGDFVAVAHGGGIGQTASVAVGGRSDLTARDDINLQQPGNTFGGAVALDASAIRLAADSNLVVDGLRTRNAGTAQVEADGDLTLSGNAIDLASGSLLATATGGQLRSRTALTGAAVVLQGRDGVAVGADITGSQVILTSDAGNVVQEAGRIQASGASALVSNSGDVTVESADNRFNDTLLLIGHDIRVAAGDLQLAGVQASGDLSLASSGRIVQTAQVQVDGNARFAADGDITLQHADNRFDGDVALQGGAVRISAGPGLSLDGVVADQLDARTQGALSLRAATVGGNALLQGGAIALDAVHVGVLDASAATGDITQGGAITAGAGSQLLASGNIVLGNADNQFGNGLQAQGGNITLANAGTLDLATLQATGTAVLSGNGVNLGAVDAAGLQVDSGAGITQSSALSVAGDSRFTAAGDVLLDDAGNQFGGGVSLQGQQVRIASAGALRLHGVAAGGDLAATAQGGDLTQTQALRVGGRSNLAASGDLLLADAGNQFGGGVAVQGQAVQLQAGSDLLVDDVRNGSNGGVILGSAGNLSVGGRAIDTGNAVLQLGSEGQLATAAALTGGSVVLRGRDGVLLAAAVTTAGDLQLVSDGADIVQSGGRIGASGTTTVDAGSGNVALGQAGNIFGGPLELRGADIHVAGSDLQLGTLAASGDLALDSSGTITQNGAVSVAGDSRLAATAITLDNGDNRFGGTVAVQAQQATLTSDAALNVQANVGGDLAARSGDLLQLQGEVGGNASLLAGQVSLGRTRVGGNLQVDSSRGITQDAALAVTGATRLSSRGTVTLDEAGNTFGGAVDVAGSGIALAAAGDLQLARVDNTVGAGPGPAAAAGAVVISATGTLILPDAAIDTGAADLSLSSGGVLQTRAALSGGNVSLAGRQGLQLGHDVAASGTLALDSDGAITQTAGALTAARLQGRAGGAAALTGANQIGQLGDFSAARLDLATQGGLQVAGSVRSSGDTQLETRGGDLLIDGSVEGDNVRLLSAAGIRAGDNGRIVATTLSGRAAGTTRLGEADRFVANQVQTLGDFQSQAGFSLTNVRTLTLASVNGSRWSVDAGTADLYLKVDGGDLLQAGTTPVYAGSSHWWSSNRIGTQAAPIHLVSDGNQHTVDFVGQPPAYFHAVNPQLMPLVLGGALNEPAAVLAARAQGAVLPRVAYLDMGALSTPYRALRIVQPGIRLPADQVPACDSSVPDAECAR